MKSCFLFIFAFFNAFLCIAQQSIVYGYIPDPGKGNSIPCIPAEFSFNGKPMITSKNNEDIDVYDFEFKLVATLKSNEIIGERFLSQVTYTRELLGVTCEKDTIIGIMDRNMTLEEFMNKNNLLSNGDDALFPFTIDGKSCLTYLRNSYSYESNMYASEYYGNQYPIFYFCLDSLEDGTECITRHIRVYKPQYSDWQHAEDIYSEERLNTLDFYYYNLDRNNTSVQLLATQTLFNDDEEFEYIMPIYEHRNIHFQNPPDAQIDQIVNNPFISESIITIKSESISTYVSGISICNGSGEELDRILFEDGCLAKDYFRPFVITFGGNSYMTFNGYIPADDNKYDYVTIFYKIDKNTNSIKHVMSSKNYGVSVEEQKIIVNNLPAGINVSAYGLNGILVDSKVSDGGSVYLNTKGGNVVLSIGQDSKVVHIK